MLIQRLPLKHSLEEKGGSTVTSSNAHKMVKWAFQREKTRFFFLPDQHLGRNTAFDIGVPLEQMAVWDPINDKLEFEGDLDTIKVILWKGHCSVHEKFTVQRYNRCTRRVSGNAYYRSSRMSTRSRCFSR